MVSSTSGGNFNETPRTRVTLANAIKNSAKGGMILEDYLIREDSVTAFFMGDVMNNNSMQSRNSTPRIMVVDDTEDILLIIKIGLEEKNLIVDAFSSAKSALEAFERHAPDYYNLVLTDIRMPNINGFALYLYLKEKNPFMKIVFMTAFDIPLQEFREIIPAIEINDIIKKPFNIDDLAMQIKHNLGSQKNWCAFFAVCTSLREILGGEKTCSLDLDITGVIGDKSNQNLSKCLTCENV